MFLFHSFKIKKSIISKFNFILFLLLLTFYPVSAQIQLTNLPSVYITTANNQAITDKVTWLTGNITVVGDSASEEINMPLTIRGRGNSTWNLAKKPYRIKLDKKTNFLKMPARAKDWVLLANYADKSLIRNAVAFKIGELLGFEFTPSVKFIDFILNNVYQGSYMATDQMEVNPGRVNIDELDSIDITEPTISGGYLLEIDGFASGEPVWFTTAKGLKITVKSPDNDIIKSQQLDYIKNYISDIETRLFSVDFKDPVKGYRSKIDSTSLVNWYLACELTGNSDAFWSTYVYKKRADDKLYFGPMWDYDIAFNNDNRLGDATEKLMSQYAHDPKTWIQQLLLDEWFHAAVWRRWQEIVSSNISGTLNSYINETTSLIEMSEQKNFAKWNVLNSRVYREMYLFTTYAEGVDYLKTYLGKRITFLNTNLKYVEPPKPSEPFVPSNYYYLIMNKKTNNVIDVTENSVIANTKLIMWEPIDEDNGQLWQIKQINDSLYRFVNKNSGLAMAGNGRSTNLIQIAQNDNDNSQKWKIKPVNTGNVYGIVNHKSGYSINNSGGNFANGTNVVEFTNNIAGSENQQWYLQKVNLIGTGIEENQIFAQQIDLFPNPASNFVSIRFATDGPQNITFSICDLRGNQQIIRKENIADNGNQVVTIPVAQLVSGMYFVLITNEKGEKSTAKFIKR